MVFIPWVHEMESETGTNNPITQPAHIHATMLESRIQSRIISIVDRTRTRITLVLPSRLVEGWKVGRGDIERMGQFSFPSRV